MAPSASVNTDQVHELLLQALETERGGIQIYTAALKAAVNDDLKKKLETVPGAAAVKVGGGLEDEIQVELDLQKLSQIGLSVDAVVQRLKEENINLSGGRLEQGTQRYLVRTVNQFATVEQMREMLLTTAGGAATSGGDNAQLMSAILGSRDPTVIAALRGDAAGPARHASARRRRR